MSAEDEVARDYQARAAAHRAARERATSVDRRVGVGRLICFAGAALSVTGLVEGELGRGAGLLLAGASAAAFVALMLWHSSIKEGIRLLHALERRCDDGENRVNRRWDAIAPPAELAVSSSHAFAADLHIAGTHSLVRLLPPVSRAAAQPVLEEWLLAEAPPAAEAIIERQRAVAELTPAAEWRERLSALTGRLLTTPQAAEAFAVWAESGERAASRAAVQWTARIFAVAMVAAMAGAIMQRSPVSFVVLAALVNLGFLAATRRTVNAVIVPVAGHEARLRGLGDALRHAASQRFAAPMLAGLAERLRADSATALSRFDWLTALAEVRLSPMAYAVLQVLVLWDVHVAGALDAWRRRHGAHVRGWIRALGEVETVAAFATLAHDNPSWCMPEVCDHASTTMDAQSLAHPLLRFDVRVGNDVRLGPSGDVLFVTGSNMAGKSTLLRAIGLNAVLAQAGAPVCAARMRLARVRVRTSIDVSDALERGLSLYMSELLRIKAIVDAAREAAEPPLLYIADEMLRGTNAADRHSAVVTILEHLIAAGAVGVVATHDATLAADARLGAHLRAVHLGERFKTEDGATTMWFDYRLRPGVSTSRNAIKLLELVGLGVGGVPSAVDAARVT